MTDKVFDFQHMNLIPNMCVVESRSECDTSVTFGPNVFKLPVVPANMECVINEDLCIKLASAGYFYINHRFNVDTLAFAKKMRSLSLPISISIGVNTDAYEMLNEFMDQDIYPDYITIDIAHGHSIKMKNIITWIRNYMGSKPIYILAGNVSTPDAVRDLESWGANGIKVGIGPGSACTTFNATGFGSRGIQACTVKECVNAKTKSETDIIADGGVKDPGDIVKCLVLGAKMVMVGGMFSALKDSPGSTIVGTDGNMYKEFWGSASAHQSGKKNRIEGTKKLMPMAHKTVLEECEYLKECFQSAISYGGGKDLSCLASTNYIIKPV